MKMHCVVLLLSLSLLIACQTTIQHQAADKSQTASTREEEDTSPKPDYQRAAAVNVTLSERYLEQGAYARAKQKIVHALSIAPHWPPALQGMARYLAATGEVEQADRYYKQAYRLAPKEGSVLNNYAIFLCSQKRYDESIGLFLEATRDPNYLTPADSFENAGLCCLSAHRPACAKKYFESAVVHDPNRLTSRAQLAEIAAKRGDWNVVYTQLFTYDRLGGTMTPHLSAIWQQAKHHTRRPHDRRTR